MAVRAVGCHYLDVGGAFVPAPAKVAAVPAALGLWTTADDLVRFALGWSSLLPAPLAEEAMRPLARPSASSQVAIGLGWQVNESRGVAAVSGLAHVAAASLVVKMEGQGTPGTGTGTPVKRLPTPLPGPDSRPPCVRGHRNTAPYSALQRYKVTHDGAEKKRPPSTRIRS